MLLSHLTFTAEGKEEYFFVGKLQKWIMKAKYQVMRAI